MALIEVLILAAGLAMDACAVCVAAGASGLVRGRRAAFRLSFHFGLFQFLMPVVGWYAGAGLAPLVASFDHWIALGLLSFVGIRMIRSGLAHDDSLERDPSRGWSLVTLSVATSIDALAVGFSLAMLRVTIWYPGLVIGLVTSALSLIGLVVGRHLGRGQGRVMSIAGGMLLIAIGVRIVIVHLAA